MKSASSSKFPTRGFHGEEFDPKSLRCKLKNASIAEGWLEAGQVKKKYVGFRFKKTLLFPYFFQPCRAAYHNCRYDAKARVEANFFTRYYNCRLLCEACMAEKPTAKSNRHMWYFDFRSNRPRHLTTINHTTYMATAPEVSPWSQVSGWTLGTSFHDWMHTCYLGTARDLIPSLLQDWLDFELLGQNNIPLDRRLRTFSLSMHKDFKENK